MKDKLGKLTVHTTTEKKKTVLPEPQKRTETGEYFGDILQRRIKRRSVLKGAGALSVGLVMGSSAMTSFKALAKDNADPGRRISFKPIHPSDQDMIIVPDNYSYNILIKWGDPLFPGAPEFDLYNQTRSSQEQQFGFNCDFIGFFELNHHGRALLAINHEYTSGYQMFPEYIIATDEEGEPLPAVGLDPTRKQVETEIAAHGMSIVEIKKMEKGDWVYIKNPNHNRRITGYTDIEITGPLRGHPLLRTEGGYDDSGKIVRGMLNNCAGGKTPWGTVLSCEENFDQYFANFGEVEGITDDNDPRYLSRRIPAESGPSDRKWEVYEDRFDLVKHPKEYNRFGYVVEIDPYNPDAMPKKRTALGRFKHEGAVPAITQSGHVAVYSGDDARFEYVYKFISNDRYQANDRTHNMRLLDRGTLYAAKFHDDGSGEWIPLPKDAASIINTRGVADEVGATKMDRPEDVDVSPTTHKVYVTMTKNSKRGIGESEGLQTDPGIDAANPRDENFWGHIIEITEDGDDSGATTFSWEIFMLCGDPTQQGGITDLRDLTADEAYFAGFDPSFVSPIAAPDNIVLDDRGNLWVATDGQPSAANFGQNDGVFAVPTEGPDRGYLRQFLSGIPGGEVCGPEFSRDHRSFFCGIQHPGENDGLPNSTSSWPDGNNPPKPSVISVWHIGGKKIGR